MVFWLLMIDLLTVNGKLLAAALTASCKAWLKYHYRGFVHIESFINKKREPV